MNQWPFSEAVRPLPLQKLTETQQLVLWFIDQFRRENQMPPTRAEIARHFGYRSPNAAEEVVRALKRKGYIEVRAGIARGIVVLHGGG